MQERSSCQKRRGRVGGIKAMKGRGDGVEQGRGGGAEGGGRG